MANRSLILAVGGISLVLGILIGAVILSPHISRNIQSGNSNETSSNPFAKLINSSVLYNDGCIRISSWLLFQTNTVNEPLDPISAKVYIYFNGSVIKDKVDLRLVPPLIVNTPLKFDIPYICKNNLPKPEKIIIKITYEKNISTSIVFDNITIKSQPKTTKNIQAQANLISNRWVNSKPIYSFDLTITSKENKIIKISSIDIIITDSRGSTKIAKLIASDNGWEIILGETGLSSIDVNPSPPILIHPNSSTHITLTLTGSKTYYVEVTFSINIIDEDGDSETIYTNALTLG